MDRPWENVGTDRPPARGLPWGLLAITPVFGFPWVLVLIRSVNETFEPGVRAWLFPAIVFVPPALGNLLWITVLVASRRGPRPRGLGAMIAVGIAISSAGYLTLVGIMYADRASDPW